MLPCQSHHFFRQKFQGAVKLRQAEQIRYAQQDHKQGIIKPLDDFFIRNAAGPPQYQSKAYGQQPRIHMTEKSEEN